ncbi:MAG TPA: hypothetical protein VNJ08_00205 [Bacteriovoracaceae bacterium]|nr:hypothetical protein [Bacteriovoracaceae bacterium]
MKAYFSKTVIAALLLTSFSAFADDDKIVTATADLGAGNGGVTLGVGPAIQVIPGIKIIGQVEGGLDLQTYKKDGLVGSTTYYELSPSIGGSVGLNLNLDIFHLNPYIQYKCEKANSNLPKEEKSAYGCGSRAGVKFLVGSEKGPQIGLGYSKSLTDVNHGEEHQFDLMLRIPFSANDEDRNIKSKGDMDFDSKGGPVKATTAGAVNA